MLGVLGTLVLVELAQDRADQIASGAFSHVQRDGDQLDLRFRQLAAVALELDWSRKKRLKLWMIIISKGRSRPIAASIIALNWGRLSSVAEAPGSRKTSTSSIPRASQ